MNPLVALASLALTVAVTMFVVSASSRPQILHVPTVAGGGNTLTSYSLILTPFLYTGYDSTTVDTDTTLYVNGATNQSIFLAGGAAVTTMETNQLPTCSEFSTWANAVADAIDQSKPARPKSRTPMCHLVRSTWIIGAISLIVGFIVIQMPIWSSTSVHGQTLALAAGCSWLAAIAFIIHAAVFLRILDDIAVQVTRHFDGSNDVRLATNQIGATIFFTVTPALILTVLACNSYSGTHTKMIQNPLYVSFGEG